MTYEIRSVKSEFNILDSKPILGGKYKPIIINGNSYVYHDGTVANVDDSAVFISGGGTFKVTDGIGGWAAQRLFS